MIGRIANILGRRSAAVATGSEAGRISRRAASGAALAAVLMPGAGAAGPLRTDTASLGALEPEQLAALVRGLAHLRSSGDAELLREADALLARIAMMLPEAPLLYDLHLEFRPASGAVCRPQLRIDLASLHRACHAAQPVSFDYVDLQGRSSSRRVLPLELVHPAHGILLLAWCELRGAQRKFFVQAMDNLRLHTGHFRDRRLVLLRDALNETRARYDV